MTYIVLDLEWNQTISYVERNKLPFGEIMQIGAVKLDDNAKVKSVFSIDVRPRFYSKLSSKVERLTGMTSKRLSRGCDFPSAYKMFREWCGDEYAILTWGPDDATVLSANLNSYKVMEPFPEIYDLQKVFSVCLRNPGRQYSLEQACKLMKETQFPPHDALNDAMSTALLCQHIPLDQPILEDYVQWKKINTNYFFNSDIFEVSNVILPSDESFDYQEKIKKDNYFCPDCGKVMTMTNWVTQHQGKQASVGVCEDGSKYLVRIRRKYIENNSSRVITSICPLSSEYLQVYEHVLKKIELNERALGA